MLRLLAGDADVCVTVTLLDGLVFARSVPPLDELSMRRGVRPCRARHRSRRDAHRWPDSSTISHAGRSADDGRTHTRGAPATLILRLPITEGSAKAKLGPTLDDEADRAPDLGRPVTDETRRPTADRRLRSRAPYITDP